MHNHRKKYAAIWTSLKIVHNPLIVISIIIGSFFPLCMCALSIR